MRGKKIFLTAFSLCFAFLFLMAAYLGFYLNRTYAERPVQLALLEGKLYSVNVDSERAEIEHEPSTNRDGIIEPSFQLGVVDNGLTVKQKEANHEVYLDNRLIGRFSLETEQIAETGDYYYFITYKPIVTLEQPLVLRASILSSSREASYRHIDYPNHVQKLKEGLITADTPPDLQDGVLEEPRQLDKRMELPEHSLYVDGKDFSLHLNRVNLYEPLGNGVRRAKDQLSPPFSYRQQEVKNNRKASTGINRPAISPDGKPASYVEHVWEITLPQLADHEIEHWGLIGQASMFRWEDEEQKNLYTVANLDRVRKWTQGGVQYITPITYHPYDPNGFWLVPAQHVGNRLLLSGKDRFSLNMAILSLEAALATQRDEGMWLTQPRSEWLYEDYGIEAGFYDTRFSTDAALFLIYGYREFGHPRYLKGAIRYADFLVKFASTHHFETENGGYLVWDYRDGHWDGVTRKETHVSLNHLITEMNFLLELIKELKGIDPDVLSRLMKNEEGKNNKAVENVDVMENVEVAIKVRINTYLDVAEKIRIAVQDTKVHWKKEENGDLWYAYMPDGSFGLLDYPLLTLKDLRYSQELFEEIYGERDPAFQYLIEVKEKYLRGQGLPLYD